MQIYATRYQIGGHVFSATIYASSFDDAERIAELRCIGEWIEGLAHEGDFVDYSAVDDAQFKTEIVHVVHQAIHLGWIALASGSLGLDDVLGDYGVAHEVAHFFAGTHADKPESATVDYLRRRLHRLYYKTPGAAPYSRRPAEYAAHP